MDVILAEQRLIVMVLRKGNDLTEPLSEPRWHTGHMSAHERLFIDGLKVELVIWVVHPIKNPTTVRKIP
ncbi:MAG: hypothetical protein ACE5EO_13040 [Candidatus Krumholzibacteriia bacterium]